MATLEYHRSVMIIRWSGAKNKTKEISIDGNKMMLVWGTNYRGESEPLDWHIQRR